MLSEPAASRSQELAGSSNHVDASLTEPDAPIRPPGLTPLSGERLWHPHDDEYWQHLRDMWGSRPDSPEPGFKGDNSDSEDMEDIDLRSANERTFRIALRAKIAAQTAATKEVATGAQTIPDNNTTQYIAQSTPSTSSPSPSMSDDESRNRPAPQYTFEPAPKRGRRVFTGVQVTTTTKTYGDFTRNNPPPYTPKPTGEERTFPPLEDKSTNAKWPVAKYLFICGFLFPLCWLFGAMLLMGGLRKMCSDSQLEQGRGSKSVAAGTAADGTVSQQIANEVRWAKRCGWAAAATICLGIIVFCVYIFSIHPQTST